MSARQGVSETVYRTFLRPNRPHLDILDRLLEVRLELANLTGHSSYAHRALVNTLANSPDYVSELLSSLSEKNRPFAERELAVLRKRFGVSGVTIWDAVMGCSQLKSKLITYRQQDVLPYFSIGACMEGLDNLFSSIFGIYFVAEQPTFGELWAESVIKLAVFDTHNSLLGHIYCDLFARNENKPSSDCHFTIRCGRELPDGQFQTPVVVVNCHFSPGQHGLPSMLTFSMLLNLFHEMGHAIHSMLGQTIYQHANGTRCACDFAEVPSTLMESFVSDRRVLKSIARHLETGESIPDDMADQLLLAHNVFQCFELQQQVARSLIDQSYHSQSPPIGGTSRAYNTIFNQNVPVLPIEGVSYELRFQHLIGYAARYYSYQLSQSLTRTIYEELFERDPFSRSAGDSLRHNLLKYGGSQEPSSLVTSTLGRFPSNAELIDSVDDRMEEYVQRLERL